MTYALNDKQKALLRYAASKHVVYKRMRRAALFVMLIGLVFLSYSLFSLLDSKSNSVILEFSYKHELKRHVFMMLILVMYLIGILGGYIHHLILCKFFLETRDILYKNGITANNMRNGNVRNEMTLAKSEADSNDPSFLSNKQLSSSILIANKSLKNGRAFIICYAALITASFIVLVFIVNLLLTMKTDMIIEEIKRLSLLKNAMLSVLMIIIPILACCWQGRENRICGALNMMTSALDEMDKNIDRFRDENQSEK